MNLCSGIKADGGRCQAPAITGSMYCVGHDPTRVAERRQRSSKAGRAGGRGRASAELKRLQHRFEELADQVLEGEIERGSAAIAGHFSVARERASETPSPRGNKRNSSRGSNG